MSALAADRAAGVVAAAQRLLAKRLGAPVRLIDPEELGGSGRTVVLRVRVADNFYYLPKTLIVKQVRESVRLDAWRAEPGVESVDSAFVREAVSYQFATAMAREDRPGPDLLAHDLSARLLILSDLGSGGRLASALHGSAETADNSLMAFAQALGRLHARTVGRENDFTALLRRVDVAHQPDGVATQALAALRAVPDILLTEIGLVVPDSIVGIVARCAHLFDRGRFRAFSPSDLCPDNVIVNEDGVRFLDYEWGGFRDATLDIAYVLASFPGCLCHLDLTAEQEQAMVDAWRGEVVGVWPALADDDLLARKLLDAHFVWVWLTTYWFLPDNDSWFAAAREHGLSIPRSQALLTRWMSLEDRARAVGDADIAEFAEQVTTALEAKWSD